MRGVHAADAVAHAALPHRLLHVLGDVGHREAAGGAEVRLAVEGLHRAAVRGRAQRRRGRLGCARHPTPLCQQRAYPVRRNRIVRPDGESSTLDARARSSAGQSSRLIIRARRFGLFRPNGRIAHGGWDRGRLDLRPRLRPVSVACVAQCCRDRGRRARRVRGPAPHLRHPRRLGARACRAVARDLLERAWVRERRQPPTRILFSADAVSGPTTPSGERPFACWNAITAAFVRGPKVPSTGPGSYPALDRACWSSLIAAGSPSPSRSFVPSGRVKVEAPGVDGVVVGVVVEGLVGGVVVGVDDPTALRGRGRRGGGLGDGCHRRLTSAAQEQHRDHDG